MPIDPEVGFSSQSTALLRIAMASTARQEPTATPDIRTLVRYVAGALLPSEAGRVEVSIAQDLRAGNLLAKTYRTIEALRRLPWPDLQALRPDDEIVAEIRREWIECAEGSLAPLERSTFTVASLLAFANNSLEGARAAMGLVSHLLETGLAPRAPAFAAATRLSVNLPLIEGSELIHANIRFEAVIGEDGALQLEMSFPNTEAVGDRSISIAFEANRQWLGLGSTEIRDGRATMHLAGFGKLIGLSPGHLPANIFAIRLDEWPSVCERGALVVQSGVEPFAEVETDPLIVDGDVCVDIRLLPYCTELLHSNEIEMWFGTGGQVWQLLGRWQLPSDLEGKMSLRCPSPKPGPVGIAFPGVLRLALRP